MKKIVVAFLFLHFALSLSAQRVYFIYLQSEKQLPFYIRMGDKVHSSTFSGYLILSSLKDSTYTFSLGFPGKAASESKFSIVISNNDKGYLIKDLDEGLTLFDLQNLTLLKSFSAASKATGQGAVLRTDAFTQLLSQTSDDASLLTASVAVAHPQKEVVAVESIKEAAKEEEKAPPPLEIAKLEKVEDIRIVADSIVNNEKELQVKPGASPQPEPKEQEVRDTVAALPVVAPIVEEIFVRSVITRRSESSTTEGFGLVFLDNHGGEIDTIRLLIPSPRIQIREEAPPKELEETALGNTNQNSITVQEKPAPSTALADCVTVASERDFLRLRKNMAAEVSEEKMLALARRQFKTRCYSTEQVKNLGTLFLSSSSKYQFFDLAFPAVSDRAAFRSLESELADEYYQKRFKALIGE